MNRYVLCCLLACCESVLGTQHVFTDVGPTGFESSASDVNEYGDVVGTFLAEDGWHGYLRLATGTLFDLGSVMKAPLSINNRGEIVGTLRDGSGGLWANPSASPISITPFNGNNVLTGINDVGEISGYWTDSLGGHGFRRYNDGTVEQLQRLLAGQFTRATAINNQGSIAGFGDDRKIVYEPFGVSISGQDFLPPPIPQLTNLPDTPPYINGAWRAAYWTNTGTTTKQQREAYGTPSDASAINDNNIVAGSYGYVATIWTSNVMRKLGVLPDHLASTAFAINNATVVVGVSANENERKAFVWNSTDGMQDLNVLYPTAGVTLTNAYAVNSSGYIVGEAKTESGSQSFLLKPTTKIQTQKVATYTPPSWDMPLVEPPAINKIGHVIITHGWNTDGTWTTEFTNCFKTKITELGRDDLWDVEDFGWRHMNGLTTDINPNEASSNAYYLGVRRARELKNSDYQEFQIIAHSAGAWFADGFADGMAKFNPTKKVQITFLDAYVPFAMIDTKKLGDTATFAEHYQDKSGLSAEYWGGVFFGLGAAGLDLPYAWNYDVTALNPDSYPSLSPAEIVSSWHAWPYEWYLKSEGSGYGIDLSPAIGTVTATYDSFAQGGTSKSYRTVRKNFGLTGLATITSPTGNVSLAENSTMLTTGSPVWVAFLVPVYTPADAIEFQLECASPFGADSIISVFWEDNLIGIVNEQDVLAQDMFAFALPGLYLPGEYSLAFRVDPLTEISSVVTISRLALLRSEPIPEPLSGWLLIVGCVWFASRKPHESH